MTLNSETHPSSEGGTREPSHLMIVVLVFSSIGFLTTSSMFLLAANSFVVQSLLSSIASGVSGATSWVAVCGRQNHVATGRVVLAGAIAGLIVHPFLAVILTFSMGFFPGPEQILLGSVFFFVIFGVLTVPLGILAAVISDVLTEELRRRGNQR